MPNVTLTDPVTGTTVASGLFATNHANLRSLLNGGIDYVNLKGNPQLVANEAATWNGTQFVRSSTLGLTLGGAFTNTQATATSHFYNTNTTDVALTFGQVADVTAEKFQILSDGRLRWGPGNTGSDAIFYRSAIGLLGSDTDIEARLGSANRIRLGFVASANAPGLQFGTAYDANLYRSAATQLKTDGSFIAAGSVYSQPAGAGSGFIFNPGAVGGYALISQIVGTANPHFSISTNGTQNWGPGGATVVDTNLYRAAAGVLATDNAFNILPTTAIPFQVSGAQGTPTNTGTVQAAGSARFATINSMMDIGSRSSGATWLQTYDRTNLALHYALELNPLGGNIGLGVAAPSSLLHLGSDAANPASGIKFGSAGDANLYRTAASTLRTDGTLVVGIDLSITGVQNGGHPRGSVAATTAPLELTTTFTDITGATITLATAGTYFVAGVVDFQDTTSGDGVLIAQLVVNGVAQTATAIFVPSANGQRSTVSQNWIVAVGAGQVIKLQAKKTASGGSSQAMNQHTTIQAIRIDS